MSNTLKIICCNIRVDVQVDAKEGNGWADRKGICVEVMYGQHPDVICLQECKGNQYEDLKRGLPTFDGYGLSNTLSGYNPSNAILYLRSRFDLVTAGGHWLSETPHIADSKSWDSSLPRFVNWVHLRDRTSGRQFRVWNGHFDHIGQKARVEQARLIAEGAKPFPADLPQFFTADCNADANNPAIKALKDGGWIDTYTAVHGPDDPGNTFHGFIGPKHTARIGKIDFVFYRGPVRPTAAEIIRDCRNGRYPSDHYFVSAEVELDQPA